MERKLLPPPKTGILVVDGVDLSLLEEQRLTLAQESMQISAKGTLLLSRDAVFALSGIINMLDTWSDERL